MSEPVHMFRSGKEKGITQVRGDCSHRLTEAGEILMRHEQVVIDHCCIVQSTGREMNTQLRCCYSRNKFVLITFSFPSPSTEVVQ